MIINAVSDEFYTIVSNSHRDLVGTSANDRDYTSVSAYRRGKTRLRYARELVILGHFGEKNNAVAPFNGGHLLHDISSMYIVITNFAFYFFKIH